MLTSRVSAHELQNRLDSPFYNPDAMLLDRRLQECFDLRVLDEIIDSDRKITNGVRGPDLETSQYRLVRLQDYDGWFVQFDQCLTISLSQFHQNRRCQLRDNDVIVAIGGYIGHAAIIRNVQQAVIGQHSALIPLSSNSDIDPFWFTAYLNANAGKIQLERYVSGTVQTGINLEDLRDIRIPIFPLSVQRYIGDKVRQAERLRASAQSRERRFTKLVKSAFPQLDETVSGVVKHGRAASLQLNGKLNPGAFNPDRILIRNYLLQNGGKQVLDIARIETPITSRYKKTDTYIGLDSIGSSCGTINPSTIEQEDVVGSVRLLSEGPVISKLRPYLNKVAYIPPSLNGAFGSTELLCIRAYDSALNWFLYGVLQLQSTVRQLNPVSTGSTHPRVTREDVADTFIPWLDDPVSAGRILENAQREYFASDLLVIAAKLIVEALIEGRVTEDEIAAAQIQLEHGDQTGDRAMLARLFNDGMDTTEGKRLFSDLDAHYETLQLAEENSKDKPDNGSNDRQ